MLLATLAGCGPKQDERICRTPAEVISDTDWKGCVHRLAYRLAGAGGSAKVIAEATVGGCADTVEMAQATGEPIAPGAPSVAQLASTQALFRIMQARAGHCDIP